MNIACYNDSFIHENMLSFVKINSDPLPALEITHINSKILL